MAAPEAPGPRIAGALLTLRGAAAVLHQFATDGPPHDTDDTIAVMFMLAESVTAAADVMEQAEEGDAPQGRGA